MLPMMSTRPNSDCGAVDERVDVGALGDVGALHDRGAAVGLDLVGGRLRAPPRRCRRRRSWRPPPQSISAVALPMPLPTPVSTATWPERSNSSCTLAHATPLSLTRTTAAEPTRSARDGLRRPIAAQWGMTALLALGSRISDVNVLRVPRRVRRRGRLVPLAVRAAARARLPLDGDRPRPRRRSRTAPRRTRAASSRTTALFVAGFGIGVRAARAHARRASGSCCATTRSTLTRISGAVHARDGAVPARLAVPARAVAVPGEALPSRSSAGSATRRRSSRASRSASAGRRASARSSARSSASPRTQHRVWAGATLLAVYSLGLGLPFLVTGLALGRRQRRARLGEAPLPAARRRLGRRARRVRRAADVRPAQPADRRPAAGARRRAPRLAGEPRMIPEHTSAALDARPDLAARRVRARDRLAQVRAAPQLDHATARAARTPASTRGTSH